MDISGRKICDREDLISAIDLLRESLPADPLLRQNPNTVLEFFEHEIEAGRFDVYGFYAKQELIAAIGLLRPHPVPIVLRAFVFWLKARQQVNLAGHKGFLMSALASFFPPRGVTGLEELFYFAVQNDMRGRGVGGASLSSFWDFVASDAGVMTRTLSSTPENVAFYLKNGFRIVGKRFGRVFLVFS